MCTVTKITVLWVASLLVNGNAQDIRDVKKLHVNRDYLGNYYAGHGEFPWLVDIRRLNSENYTDQEEWSIGNIIGPRYVLSTCNAVATFVGVSGVKDRHLVVPKSPHQYKVMYGPDNVYQADVWYINRYAKWRQYPMKFKAGTRMIQRMSPHPFCNPRTFRYFWGILELEEMPIKPFRHFVNYAPAEVDATRVWQRWYYVQKDKFKPSVVATWGRNSFEEFYRFTMLHNYKIKHDVQFVEWQDCVKVAEHYPWFLLNHGLSPVNNVYCMNQQFVLDKEGTICDHDRGAPVVRDGIMIGIVIAGVDFEHCSPYKPMPFVVASLLDAQVYWVNVDRHVLSYFIERNSHLFPGLTGQVIQDPTGEEESFSPTLPVAKALTLLCVSLLLILRPTYP